MPTAVRHSHASSFTDLPVNCLVRLPLPSSATCSEGRGAYGRVGRCCCNVIQEADHVTENKLGGFSGDLEMLMVGCYKHNSATDTYSGAIRVCSTTRRPLTSLVAADLEHQQAVETIVDIPLPEYGVFDLNLVGTVGLSVSPSSSVQGSCCSSPSSSVSLAPDAANSRVFSLAFIDALVKRIEGLFVGAGEATAVTRDVLYIVAAPCTDGHLRLFGVTASESRANRVEGCTSSSSSSSSRLESKVFVICDIPVADTMLTSLLLFPQFADYGCSGTSTTTSTTSTTNQRTLKSEKTFRAVCASHGGSLHLITAVLTATAWGYEQKGGDGIIAIAKDETASTTASRTAFEGRPLFELALGTSGSPSYTHCSWEGHEYDSWCVGRDPLDAAMAFWSGGDDGKLKRWAMTEEKWRALDGVPRGETDAQEEEDGEADDESEDIEAAKPSLSFSKTFEAGIVTISPLFVHSYSKREESGVEQGGTILQRTSSSHLVVGSYDENLRIYHLSNSLVVQTAECATGSQKEPPQLNSHQLAPREPLISSWKKLFETPLFEVPCEGGAWRCRTPPPHTFLQCQNTAFKPLNSDNEQCSEVKAAVDSSAAETFLHRAALDSEHTNVYEGHVFISSGRSTDDNAGCECLLPLSVAAMQRGGVVVMTPLPRYHLLQSKSLTCSSDGSAVSSAVPLNDELIDEFTIDADDGESVLFLEKNKSAGDESDKKEPLIYDICPIPAALADANGAVGGLCHILACSFYDKEILGFKI